MKSRCREEIKRKEVRDTLFSEGGESIVLLEGSQATPACSSDRNNVKVQTL
jgi:hypothetical protein